MRVLSLFDGISCGRLALGRAGVSVSKYYSSEIDKYALQISSKNFPQDNADRLGDICKITKDLIPDGVDLIIGGSPCFVAGTKVITSNGYKNIEDVKVGDMVLTHKNRFKVVLKVGGKMSQTINLKAQGILKTETTKEHPYYIRTMKDGVMSEPYWKEVKDLKKGDYIGSPIINIESNIYNLTKEQCWLIGRYIADGHIKKEKRKERKNSYMYSVIYSIGSSKLDKFKERVVENRFTAYKHSKSVYRCCFYSKDFVELLEKLEVGKRAIDKNIPMALLNLPKDLLEEVLDGYMSGDGCVIRNSHKATTISEKLAMSLCLAISKSKNKGFTILKCIRPKTHIIQGRVVNQNDTYTTSYLNNNSKAQYKIIDDIVWLPFRSISETGESKQVYNLEVEDDNSYTANNAIVHNCQSLSRSGDGSGFDGKSKLFWEFVRVLKVFNPKYFLLENVEMKKEWEDVITKELGVEPIHINSSDYSAQKRPRVYWTNIPISQMKPSPQRLEDILIGGSGEIINNHPVVLKKEGGEFTIKNATKLGYLLAKDGDCVNLEVPNSKTRRGRVSSGKTNTLNTACNYGVVEDGNLRTLCITEYERLQNLPDGYTVGVSEYQRKKMIGNGWTVDVIADIFRGLKYEK